MSAPTSARPEFYVPLPRRLLDDLRDSPLAIGVYALVSRLFRATRSAVPISPADLCSLDVHISYGAATRALQRLVTAGYLSAARTPGHKSIYTPTWGFVGGVARLWELGAPYLGRPRHIRELHLPQRLLDTYLGRLDPHRVHPGRVTRYTTAALLGLADAGAYGLAMLGLPAPSAALSELGLLANGEAQPLPADEQILALASQRRLFDDGHPVALSPAGWARTAFAPPPAAEASDAGGEPLFFVPKGQIGPAIAPTIAHPIAANAQPLAKNSASPRPRGRTVPPSERSHVAGCKKVSDPPPSQSAQTVPTGGGESFSSPSEPSESERLLRLLGVRAEVARSLSDRPAEQVRRLIAQAKARPGINDRAGWVVSALRALPAAPALAAPVASDLLILTHAALSNIERARWLARFRNADPADRPALLERFCQEHGREPQGTGPLQAQHAL